MKLRFVFTYIFLLVSISVFSQSEYERRISVTEWITEMANCKTPVYRLQNTEIYLDFETDKNFHPNSINDIVKGKLKLDTIKINARIEIKKCKFPESTYNLSFIDFEKNITLYSCNGNLQVRFYKCNFKQGVDIRGGEMGRLQFIRSAINSCFVFSSQKAQRLSFYKCNFIRDKVYKSMSSVPKFYKLNCQICILNSEMKNFIIYKCKFNLKNKSSIIDITYNKFDNVVFDSIDFKQDIVNFEANTISDNFYVDNCNFRKPLAITSSRFPADGTNFNWEQLAKNGIAIISNDELYTAKTDSMLGDKILYNELISVYKKFHIMYRTRGDMESANDCYIAMKDIETNRLALVFKKEGSLDAFIHFQLNRFLKFFCFYGTSPIRAVIISMWTVLFFAIIYFFFYSEWDKINRTFLMNKLKNLVEYFQSNKTLADYYKNKQKSKYQSYNEFRNFLKESRKKVPFFVNTLGKPLYLFSITRYKFVLFLYKKIDLLKGCWTELSFIRKFFIGIITFFSIIIFIVYIAIVRLINSLFLSLNTFSTLGFGHIPVTGISRYLAILEGFLGWFLLSIFSVSLINQILQS